MRLDPKWIDTFAEVFTLCGVKPGDACAILSETQSRAALVQLSELALARLGARWFHVVLPTPRQTAPVPVRSTGASDAIGGLGPVVREGCGHAQVTQQALGPGPGIHGGKHLQDGFLVMHETPD